MEAIYIMNYLSKIDEYIKLLNLSKEFDEMIFRKVNELLINVDEEIISLNKVKVAQLFCLNISKLNHDIGIGKGLASQIIESFKNIGKMEADEGKNGNVRTIIFLNQLYSAKDTNTVRIKFSDNNELEKEFKILLEHLEQIKGVFGIKINGKPQFPINKLLSTIITGEDFIGDTISVTSFRTLILALEIFKYDGYTKEKESVTNLIKECNLKSIDYIMNDNAIKIGGEKSWKDNLDRNGVLILYNNSKKKILIRRSEKEYFNETIWSPDKGFDIHCEINKSGKEIAWFCEYDYDEEFDVKSIESFLENRIELEHVKNILQLILEKKCYNIFHEQALLVKGNEIIPINPFTKNDKFLCNSGSATRSELEVVINILKKYSLQVLIGKGIDCATIGLILELFLINPVAIEKILTNINKTSSNIQNLIVRNWLNESDNIYSAFNHFYSKFESELEYVKKRNTFEEKGWSQNSFYPIVIYDDIIDMINLNKQYIDYRYELIRIEEDYKSNIIYKLKDDTEISNPKIKYYNNEEKDYLNYRTEFLALYNPADNELIVGTEIDNNNKLIEKIKRNNKFLIKHNYLEVITDIHVKIFLNLMNVHKRALVEAFYKDSQGDVSFDSLVRYKLINNLLCFKIIPDKLDKYLYLLSKHDLIDYSIVKDDKIIKEISNGTLVVPKDRSNAQSVLKDIYNEYIKDNNKRSKVDFYDISINEREGYYYINKTKINKILFVFDNIEGGTATRETLKEYLGDNEIGRKRQRFYCNGKEVTIKDIIDRNEAKIVIDIFYASERGMEVIQNFSDEKGLEMKIEPCKIINSIVTKEMLDVARELFDEFVDSDDCVKEGNYIIIREFNQPKKNIFPPSMLDPHNIISLFVKKNELKK